MTCLPKVLVPPQTIAAAYLACCNTGASVRPHGFYSNVSLAPNNVAQRAVKLAAGLQRLHSNPRQAMLLYHHVKKSGGTAMCDHIASINFSTWSCTKKHEVVSDAKDFMACNCLGGYKPHEGKKAVV